MGTWIANATRGEDSLISQLFPPLPLPADPAETAAIQARALRGWCLVCASLTSFQIGSENLREDVVCCSCGSFNRQRQLLAVLLHALTGAIPREGVLALPRGLRLWTMESSRALQAALARHLGSDLVASEYLGDGIPSGTPRGGVLHVDARRTHFADGSLDVVLSSDVLEHVPQYREALQETARVLRPGGWHVLTVPFDMGRQVTQVRAVVEQDGTVRHLLPPAYHGDPVRPAEGVLVYQIFGQDLLADLERSGFEPRLYRVHEPVLGILGDGVVLAARRRAA
jgi:SAM-dependent methyltransferase